MQDYYDEQREEKVEVELSFEVIEQISHIASQAAIRAVRSEEESAYKRRKKRIHKKVYNSLSSYRTMKKLLAKGKYEPIEQAEMRWKFMEDLMSNNFRIDPDRVITEEEKRIQENTYAVYRIENALAMFESECKAMKNEERFRRYRILREKFIDGEPKTVAEMANAENIAERTVYKDINIAVDIMAIYIYGAVDI